MCEQTFCRNPARTMQTFYFTIFFLLSCASAVNLGRRHLYDDVDSLPPPLSPISPPFFPIYSSSSSSPPPSPSLPPPDTFSAFHTFPANISALVLPRSPKSHSDTTKLLLPAISAVLIVATTFGIALFLYGRWKGQTRHFKDTSTSSSSSSSHDEETRLNNNFSVAASTSTSDVYYLPVEETRTCIVKPESPEIQPLPPLPRSFLTNYEADYLSDEGDEEEDEFYSPLASLAPSETSSPSHSCPSSTWISPARSFSPSHHSDASSIQNLQSPSPERLRVRNNNRNGSSLRMFSFWNQNLGFPRISSASTSPDRAPEAYAFSSLYSSVSNSPDGLFRKFLDSPSPIWNEFGRNVKSVLFSSDSISSRRDFVINIGESSSRFLNQRSETTVAPPPPTRPAPLVPPSQSFVVQNDAKIQSFSELPLKQLHWDCVKSSSFK